MTKSRDSGFLALLPAAIALVVVLAIAERLQQNVAAGHHEGTEAAEWVGPRKLHRWRCWDPGSPIPCHPDLEAVDVLAPDDVWAVGEAGLVLHWDGNGWTRVPTPGSVSLTDISMLSATHGWAVGWTGTILKWDGSSWSVSLSPDWCGWMWAVDAVTETDAWAVGKGGAYRWDGTTWKLVTMRSMDEVDMVSSTDGWAIGGGLLYRWNGSRLTEVRLPGISEDSEVWLTTVDALSASDVWVARSDGEMYHWDGGGWSIVRTPTDMAVVSIAMQSESHGWALSSRSGLAEAWEGDVLRWDGHTWSLVPAPSNSLVSIDAIGDTEAWAVGYLGSIAHYYDKVWLTESGATNGYLHGIDMVGPADGWAVGAVEDAEQGIYRGAMMRWDGSSWSTAPVTSIDYSRQWLLRDVHMTSTDNGWAVGGEWIDGWRGLILRWDGRAWSEHPHPPEPDLNSIDLVSPTDGWAVGGGYDREQERRVGAAFHWDGSEWSESQVSESGELQSVSFVGRTDGWAVSYREILRWDGSNWFAFQLSPSELPEFFMLESIDMVSSSDGWAVGEGIMLRWNGESWEAHDLPPCCNTFRWVHMLSSDDGWAGGDNLVHWDGNEWSTVAWTFPLMTASATLVSEHDGWAVGSTYSGAMGLLRYDPTWSVDSLFLPLARATGKVE